MQLRQVLRDGQAQAQSAARVRGCRVRLAETIEHMGQEIGTDPDAAVRNTDLGPPVQALHGNPDVTLLGRELHRVGQQVHHHLLQAARVAQDRTGRQVEHLVDPYALFLRSRPDALGSRIDEVPRLDGLDVQAYPARSHAAHVHQILDQLGLQVHALFDHVQAPVELLFAAAPAQHMCPSEDGAQGAAQFVRDDGQELVPQGAGPLGFGPCSLTLAQRLARRGEFLFEVRAHTGLRRHILANRAPTTLPPMSSWRKAAGVAARRTQLALKAFVVEDNLAIRESLIEALRELTGIVTAGVAGSQKDAVAWLSDSANDWDIAIVDLILEPGGSGFGVLNECRNRGPDRKMVVLTATANPDVRKQCEALGCDGVFDKSIETDALIDYCLALAQAARARNADSL